MLKLEFPNESHRDQYLEMIKEWGEYEMIPTSPSKLFSGATYDEFLEIIIQDLTDNPLGVNATLFFLVDESTRDIIGALHVRHRIRHPKLGHIGYGVRPSARGKGYATQMLALGLQEAKKLGINPVRIACHDANIASAKVIEANGGIFEGYTEKDGVQVRKYWIDTH